MKKTDKPTDETPDAERVRVAEQLARVQAEQHDIEQQCEALDAEKAAVRMRAIADQDAGAHTALDRINTLASVVRLRREDLAAVAAALTQDLAALDAEIRRRDFRAGLVAFRENQAALIALAKECDALSETTAEALARYQAAADALQRQGRGLGVTHINRLTDRDSAAGSLMRHLDPRREIASQIHPRYRRPLSEQAADGAPAWAFEDRDPPEGWQPTHHNTDDAPSAATADTAAA